MKKNFKYIFVPIISTVLLTGCWDSTELNDRHVVLELAIDKAETQDDYYEIIYTIPDVSKLSGQESLAEDVKSSMMTTSPTISKSINDVESKIQNTLTFSHAKAIVFGQELLEDQKLFKEAIDNFSRDVKFGRGINLLVTEGKAGEITKSDNYQNPILGLYIMKYFNNTKQKKGYTKQQSLGNFVKEIRNTGVSILPIITNSEGEKTVEISGAAVIKNYQLVGNLDKDEVQGMLFINGNIEDIPLVIQYGERNLTYVIENKKCQVNFIENNGIDTNIDLLIDGYIAEGVKLEQNELSDEQELQLESLIAEKVNEKINSVVKKEYKLNVDFLNLGTKLYQDNPKLFSLYAKKGENISVNDFHININTDVIIQNVGLIE